MTEISEISETSEISKRVFNYNIDVRDNVLYIYYYVQNYSHENSAYFHIRIIPEKDYIKIDLDFHYEFIYMSCGEEEDDGDTYIRKILCHYPDGMNADNLLPETPNNKFDHDEIAKIMEIFWNLRNKETGNPWSDFYNNHNGIPHQDCLAKCFECLETKKDDIGNRKDDQN